MQTGRTNRQQLALALTLCVIIQAMVTGTSLIVPVLAPALARIFAVDPVASGLYISLIYLVASASSNRASIVLRHLSPLGLANLSLMFATLGAALLLTGAVWGAILAALVIGIGYGLTSPATSALLAILTAPDARALVFSIKQASVPLGGMLAAMTLPSLLHWPVFGVEGWRSAITIVLGLNAVVMLSVLLLARRQVRTPKPTAGVGGSAPLIQLVQDQRTGSLVIASFIFAGFQLAVSAYLVVYLVETVGFSLVEAGGLFAATQVVGIGGRFLWGALADRLHANRAILLGLAAGMTAAGALAGVAGEGPPLWVILMVCSGLGLTVNGWTGLYMAELVRHAPTSRVGAITGAAMTITFAGVVVGPTLFGLVSALFDSYAAGFSLFAGAGLVAVILLRPPGVRT